MSGALIIFNNMKNIQFWVKQRSPIMLIIHHLNSIYWMDVRSELLKIANIRGRNIIKIDFKGERFDVMSVRQLRDIILNGK